MSAIESSGPSSLGEKLDWYASYNAIKHDRNEEFKEANLSNVVEAVCGLVVLIASQFHTETFLESSHDFLVFNNSNADFTAMHDEHFLVSFPRNVPPEERYGFSYEDINDVEEPFQC